MLPKAGGGRGEEEERGGERQGGGGEREGGGGGREGGGGGREGGEEEEREGEEEEREGEEEEREGEEEEREGEEEERWGRRGVKRSTTAPVHNTCQWNYILKYLPLTHNTPCMHMQVGNIFTLCMHTHS